MNTKAKWIVFGAVGAVGLGLAGGGAAAVASSMDLRSSTGTVVPGGAIDSGVTDGTVTLDVTPTGTPDPAATVDPTPSAPSPATPASPLSPATPASPASPASPVSAVSPASPASVASAPSN